MERQGLIFSIFTRGKKKRGIGCVRENFFLGGREDLRSPEKNGDSPGMSIRFRKGGRKSIFFLGKYHDFIIRLFSPFSLLLCEKRNGSGLSSFLLPIYLCFFSFPTSGNGRNRIREKRKLYPRPNFVSASILFLPPFFSYSFSFFARLFLLQPMHASSSTKKPMAGTTTRGEEEEKRGLAQAHIISIKKRRKKRKRLFGGRAGVRNSTLLKQS